MNSIQYAYRIQVDSMTTFSDGRQRAKTIFKASFWKCWKRNRETRIFFLLILVKSSTWPRAIKQPIFDAIDFFKFLCWNVISFHVWDGWLLQCLLSCLEKIEILFKDRMRLELWWERTPRGAAHNTWLEILIFASIIRPAKWGVFWTFTNGDMWPTAIWTRKNGW